jgi:hypothetical protein
MAGSRVSPELLQRQGLHVDLFKTPIGLGRPAISRQIFRGFRVKMMDKAWKKVEKQRNTYDFMPCSVISNMFVET